MGIVLGIYFGIAVFTECVWAGMRNEGVGHCFE